MMLLFNVIKNISTYKDSISGIWELADPVVSPAHTDGLIGTFNEVKLKYVSDNRII